MAAIRIPSFVVSLIVFGAAQGASTSIGTLMSQIMCPRGYFDEFAGLTMAILMISGLLGGTVISLFVDKTKLYSESIKVCFAATLICFVGLSMFLLFPNMQPFIIALIALFGVAIFPLWPLFLELGVECTFPDVSEVTSNTLLLMGGQVFAIVFITLGPYLATPLNSDELPLSVCNSNPLDYKFFLMALSIVLAGAAFLTILCLHTEFKWLTYDREQEKQLSAAFTSTPIEALPINDDSSFPALPVN